MLQTYAVDVFSCNRRVLRPPLVCAVALHVRFEVRVCVAKLRLVQEIAVDLIPRRFFDWKNKPQRNRIVADFAGFNSEIKKVAIGRTAKAEWSNRRREANG